MKRFTMAVALVCLLSVSVLAGDIPCGAPSPASDGITQTPGAASPGEIPSGGVPGEIPSGGFVSDAALSALLTVLSLAIG